MIFSQIQAASAVPVPATISQTLKACGFGPIYGRVGLKEINETMIAAGIHYLKRAEVKAWLNSEGLLEQVPA